MIYLFAQTSIRGKILIIECKMIGLLCTYQLVIEAALALIEEVMSGLEGGAV